MKAKHNEAKTTILIPEIFIDAYHQQKNNGSNGCVALSELKEKAWQQFIKTGLPHRNIEEWKYTGLNHFNNLKFELVTAESCQNNHNGIDQSMIDSHRIQGAKLIVFIDGHYAGDYSDEMIFSEGVTVEPLSQCIGSEEGSAAGSLLTALFEKTKIKPSHIMAQLNTALFEDGLLLNVAKHTCIEDIQCLYIATGNKFVNYRHVINLADNACATLIETSISLGDSTAGFTNIVSTGNLARGATFNHYKLSQESKTQQHIAGLFVDQAKGSFLRSHHAALGGDLTRYDVDVKLHEPGAHCFLDGIYIPTAKQHVDNHVLVEHLASHTTSEQHFKGVLDDQSRGVFNGKVIVHEGTSQITAHQSNHNLLLSSRAEINTKPELEIYADDVKCSHGATVGQLDEKALFYLKSRGIAESEARGLLTHAFVSDIIAKIVVKNIHDHVECAARVKMDRTVVGFNDA
ncbi:hypothetical protein AVI51_02375 [Piscirickettsia salmonis]|uniref:FeS cluster assembly protein SufD n=1 Tax=Piscirickettsia salmonis TaxID=1238 RepID=A0A9Q6LT65_PISSA|nr:Fe-S cluster assembly protein SufD [Piscirickettsia salmonis]ALA24907.1 feS assembly protein SufD [Piscirickettsia salmonis]APS45216.1 hypothetical protein AVI48_13080 [Piscirickettsia salmonis]APS48577.1 hypothetical protein AVI49_13690 [Piscirickettsia salmonis]APS49836.1 hypothetical protein AVI50_02415 [Piscirickettsia salmonis]APS53022.1 hypothetical protein AVI51_02375 [Piscirickettsia salmonis]